MKKFGIAFFVLFAFVTGIQAQLAKPAEAPGPGFCDEVIPKVRAKLKEDANANCTSIFTCLECEERTLRLKMYVTLVVQPENPPCKGVAMAIQTEAPAVSRGENVPVPRFVVDILQSACFAGGTNLEVFLPGYGQASREFGYLWEVDGNKAGHLPSVQCACGKEARVRVTQLATGLSITKIIPLRACGSSD